MINSVTLFNGNVDFGKIKMTGHAREDRKARFNLVKSLDSKPTIDNVFVVDKGHRDGKEIHCVSRKGIIYILNLRKYMTGHNSLITVMVARPNQIKRLYNSCNLFADANILKCAKKHQQLGFNLI